MTSNASNTTFLFDTFTIPYINTQYLNVASNIVLTGNLSAPLANITTLNVNYLTVNSAVVYGTSTLNVYGVSNLSTVTAQTMNVYGDCFIGNTAITGSVQTTTGPMSRLTFDNTANTSIYPNKIVLYANTASSQYCGFGVTGIGPTGGASISYGARANHIFYTGTTLSTEVMRITSGSTVGVGTTTPTAKFHVVGNIYASNAVTTTNLFANTLTMSNATSTIDVTGNVYASNAITTTNVFTTNVTATGIQTIAGLAGLTSLNVTGNVYASNALTTTNVFTNNVTATGIQTIAGLAGRTSLNVTGNVYVSNAITTTNVFTTNVTATGIQTIAGLAGLTSLNVTGNVYVSNAVTTTNVFAATETLTGTTGQTTLNVTGNLYVSNAITTTNLTCAGFTSNVSNTIFNYSTLTIPFVYTTTLNVYASANVLTLSIPGSTGQTSLNVTGNIYASNALSTTNVFVSNGLGVGPGTLGSNVVVFSNISGGANTFVMDSNGRVSIGATTQAGGSLLSFGQQSANKVVTLFDGSSADNPALATNFYGFGRNTNVLRYQVNDTGASHAFFGGSTEYARITGTGISILTGANPTSNLQVAGNAYISNAVTTTNVFVSNVFATNGLDVGPGTLGSNVVVFSNISGGSNVFVMDSNGRIGIGKTNPATALDVTGTVTASGNISANGSNLPVRWSTKNTTAFPQNAGTKYYKIATLGTTADTNNGGRIRISGTIGGYINTTGIDGYIISRGGLNWGGTLTGYGGDSTVYSDIVIYLEADGTFSVYIIRNSYYQFDLLVWGETDGSYGVTVFPCPTTDTSIITPTGTLQSPTLTNACKTLVATALPGRVGSVGIGTATPSANLHVTGNVYISNAVTTTTYYGNVNASNVVVTPATGVTGINVTGNIYASNALSTTNLFANTLTMSNASSTINVTGNIYASNAVTTTNLFTAGITSNVTSTIFNSDTLTIPFVYSTTLNVASTSNLDVVTITGEPGLTSLNVTGNAFVSNALTTTNVFASDIILASSTLGTVVAGQMEYNTYLYGTINTTSGRGSVPIDYIYRLTTPTAAYGIASNNFFTGTATGTGARLNLEASSVYDIEAYCYFTKTTAGTVTWILATSSAPTLITAAYTASPITGISGGTPVTSYVGGVTTAVTFQTTGSLSSGVSHSFLFKIQVLTNLATTFGITATQSDGTMTSLAGSYYRVTKLSTTTGVFA
jgi:hypothetical protein